MAKHKVAGFLSFKQGIRLLKKQISSSKKIKDICIITGEEFIMSVNALHRRKQKLCICNSANKIYIRLLYKSKLSFDAKKDIILKILNGLNYHTAVK